MNRNGKAEVHMARRYTQAGTHLHENVTTEQTVVSITKEAFGQTGVLHVEVDATEFVQNNVKLEVSRRIGADLAKAESANIAANQTGVILPLSAIATDFTVTLKSTTLEGAQRSIPWRIIIT